jgi:branched-chain amino acid transport system substrate-binding protein
LTVRRAAFSAGDAIGRADDCDEIACVARWAVRFRRETDMLALKRLAPVAASITLGLLVVACGGGGGGGAEAGGGGTPKLIGDGALKVGYVLPETGQLAFLGPPQIQGLRLAVAAINADGGVLGKKIPAPLAGDEAGDQAVAQQSADRVLAGGVQAVVGAAASGMTLAIIDKITGAQVVECSASNTAPTFTTYRDDGYYFRTAPSDALQGPVLADTIVSDGHSKLAIVARADDYGKGLAASTAKSMRPSESDRVLADLAREIHRIVSQRI